MMRMSWPWLYLLDAHLTMVLHGTPGDLEDVNEIAQLDPIVQEARHH